MVLWQIHAYGGGGGKVPFRAGIGMSGSSNAIASMYAFMDHHNT